MGLPERPGGEAKLATKQSCVSEGWACLSFPWGPRACRHWQGQWDPGHLGSLQQHEVPSPFKRQRLL